MTWLLSTDESGVLLGQRLLLAAVFFPHGAQKLLGWFGGYGYTGTMRYFTETARLPWLVAFLVVCIESLSPIALALGLLARPAALGVIALMVGAVLTTHLPNGFFMNWFGNQKGEGFEYHLLVIALALPIVVLGAGRASLDGVISRRLVEREGHARDVARVEPQQCVIEPASAPEGAGGLAAHSSSCRPKRSFTSPRSSGLANT